MPVFGDSNLIQQPIANSPYQFSATRIGDLGAAEYTLATVMLDVSGSTGAFRAEMEDALEAIVLACRKSPRADNMMLRVAKFDDRVVEVHGFKPLPDCNPADYRGSLGQDGGLTALFDACYTSVRALVQYGGQLTHSGMDVNGAVFVVTDGMDNKSKAGESMVSDVLRDAVRGEQLESLSSVLVGLNVQGPLDGDLRALALRMGFSEYVPLAHASPDELARLADFIGRSVVAQSQVLGTGGPSRMLFF